MLLPSVPCESKYGRIPVKREVNYMTVTERTLTLAVSHHRTSDLRAQNRDTRAFELSTEVSRAQKW